MRSRLALFGARPRFESPLHVAQLNLPPWDRLEHVFRAVFERHVFANHGPLVCELDRRFANFEAAPHGISVTNGTVALMLLAKAAIEEGEVIVPSFTFPATVQALLWAGLKPVFCDVNPETHMIDADLVQGLITKNTRGIMGVHLWGRPCDPDGLSQLCAERDLTLVFDGCHAAGCSLEGKSLSAFGVGTAYSFHATKIICGAEGGAIIVRSAALAEKLQTMRSFHASQTRAQVPLRFNAKMSEAQAALALESIEDFDGNRRCNRERYLAYQQIINTIPGLKVVPLPPSSNFQYVVVDVDEPEFGLSRDQLHDVLEAENVLPRRYFMHGCHRLQPFAGTALELPVTDALCSRLIQLPNMQSMSLQQVREIGDCIRCIREQRGMIRRQLEK